MMAAIGKNVCEKLFHVQIQRETKPPQQPPLGPARRRSGARARRSSRAAAPSRARPAATAGPGRKKASPCVATEPKVGRNDPCPCGSGKKYKKCHGAVATV